MTAYLRRVDGYGIQPFQQALVPEATRHEESMDEEKSFPKHVASGTHAAIGAARGRVASVAKGEAAISGLQRDIAETTKAPNASLIAPLTNSDC